MSAVSTEVPLACAVPTERDGVAGGLPPLRLLPAPPCEPPYDDELGLPPVLTQRMPAAPALRLVTTDGGETHMEVVPIRVRTALDDLPPPRPHAHALVQCLLEVVAGLRPLTQLRRELSLELYDRLEQSLTEASAACSTRPRGPRPDRRSVRSLHVQARPDGVAEVCATVRRGTRAAALALRLEGVQGAWQCTDLAGV